MPRPKTLRSVGLEAWLNANYADKGGYAKYTEMKLAQAGPTKISRQFEVNDRTISNWDFFDNLEKNK